VTGRADSAATVRGGSAAAALTSRAWRSAQASAGGQRAARMAQAGRPRSA
jgi:hypothetical protein